MAVKQSLPNKTNTAYLTLSTDNKKQGDESATNPQRYLCAVGARVVWRCRKFDSELATGPAATETQAISTGACAPVSRGRSSGTRCGSCG